MGEKKANECADKILEATKEDFPSFLLFCIGKEAGGFVLMTAKTKEDDARLMAHITQSLVDSPELYATMKAIMSKVNSIKGVN